MKRGLASLAICFLMSVCALPQGQNLSLRRIQTDIKNDSLQISLEFSTDISSLASLASLDYTVVTKEGLSAKPSNIHPAPIDTTTPRLMVFLVPVKDLLRANDVELSFSIKNGDTVLYASPATRINVAYLNDLQVAQSKNTDYEKKLAEYAAANAAKDGVIAAYREHTQAKAFTDIKSVFTSDTRVIIDLELDQPGKIVTIISNPDLRPKSKTFSTPSKTHRVVFDEGLAPGKDYIIEAVILDINSDVPTAARVTGAKDSRLRVHTKPSMDTFTVAQEVDPSNGKIAIKLTANQPGFVGLDYQEVLDAKTAHFGILKHKGEATLDEYKVPSGTAIKDGEPATFVLDDVVPGKTYSVTIKGFDAYGRELPRTGHTVSISLPELPKALAIAPDKPVIITVNPLTGVTVSWSATVKPKAASFVVLFSETISTSAKATIPDNGSITATLPVDQLAKSIQDKDAKKIQPTLRLVMEDNAGKSVTQDFQVAFTQPSADAVAKASAAARAAGKSQGTPSNTTTDQDLLNTLKDAANGKKISWGNLLKTGLSLLVSIL